MKLLAISLCLLLAAPSIPFAQDDKPSDAPPTRPRKPGLVEPGADTSHLKELIRLLEAMSDDDFDAAAAQAPKKNADAPQTVSRAAALQSAYSTLAAAEYKQAGKEAAAPQETGWAVDLLQWLGNAAINYALMGGQTYVGRGIDDSKTGKLNRKIDGLQGELAKTDDAKQKAELHAQIGAAYEELAAGAFESPVDVRAAQKEARLKRLIATLKSMSDDDYTASLAQLPKDSAASAQVASREAAVKAAYQTLAAIEYNLAGESRAKDKDAATVGVDPQTLKETGWAIDLLKWLGNASINYALNGGQTYVGRKLKDSPADKVEKDLAALETKLAKADSPEKRAAVHAKMAADYEKLAELGLEPESDAERAARKSERLNELAGLLQSVSDAEYKEALKHLHGDAAKRPELASRKAVLKSTYVTLAALEYRSGGEKASVDLKRLSEEDAKDVVVNPDTLQETGWFSDMLEIATLGGVGYLVYEEQRKHHRHDGGPAYQPPPPPPNPGPGSKPKCYEGMTCSGPRPSCPKDGSVDVVVLPPQDCQPPNPGPCSSLLMTQGPDGKCQTPQRIQGSGPANYDGLWLMSWTRDQGAGNPSPCTGTDEVTVSGGKFSYTAHLFCPCYVPPPPPGWVQNNNEPSFGCEGYATQFACTGGIDQNGQITGANSGGPRNPYAFAGQCLSAGGCTASGAADGVSSTLSGFNTATCPNGSCLPAQASPLAVGQTPPIVSTPVPFSPPPNRAHCMAWPACRGYSVPVRLASAKVSGLYASLDSLHTELTVLEVGSPRAAELHQKIGSVYEELAGAVEEKPKPKPEPQPKKTPARQPVKTVEKPQPPAAEPAQPAQETQPTESQTAETEPAQAEAPKPPTKEELLHKEMSDMDDLEKEMRKKVDNSRQ